MDLYSKFKSQYSPISVSSIENIKKEFTEQAKIYTLNIDLETPLKTNFRESDKENQPLNNTGSI